MSELCHQLPHAQTGVHLHAHASLSSFWNWDWEGPEQCLLSLSPSLALLSTPRSKGGQDALRGMQHLTPCTKPEWASLRPHFSGQTLLLLSLLTFRFHLDFPQERLRGDLHRPEGGTWWKTTRVFENAEKWTIFPSGSCGQEGLKGDNNQTTIAHGKTYQSQPRQVRQL